MPDPLLLTAVLAAGASRRLGRPKQLVAVDGQPLLRRQCRVTLDAGIGPVTAVLGCHADACAATIADLPVTIVVNGNWAEGLAASIRTAVGAAADAGAAGVLILHADQYRLTASALRALYAAWIGSGALGACRARHADYAGPPVILPAACFEAALQLRGDDGARGVLSALPPGSLIDVEMPNATADLDLPGQLEMLDACLVRP